MPQMAVLPRTSALVESSLAALHDMATTSVPKAQTFRSKLVAVRHALLAVEEAYYDPTMVSQLYFPEDQIYFVFCPLLLPLLVPLLGGVVREVKRMRKPVRTLLEQLKTMFGKKAGIPLDKIPPTVGLNSTYNVTCIMSHAQSAVAKVDISRTNVIFWDLGGQRKPRRTSMLAHPELSDVPLLVLANKSDLDTAQTSAELTARLELDQLAESHQWTQRPISALTTYTISESQHHIPHVLSPS
ncbi:hypothetical protein DYB26_004675 [Aphanomyces astaci]|uniref:Uncharacterized protein n=1 Tax=Aphanomyces astaci TaxID=112090 RepID=A0A3R6Y989_APHAT|nr:hypothetical protein DYB26_004675 [Aphanomyces astaci]